MSHVILLGDSIFDNARYVPDRPAVIEQLRQRLPPGWRATLLAVDGDMTEHIAEQLKKLPLDATHLFVSAGGNDALSESDILGERVSSVAEALALLDEIRTRFQRSYRAMLDALAAVGKPFVVCTVYDTIPGLEPAAQAALASFNEIILREAFAAGSPVIDLRLVCDQRSDYSYVSSIEPSVTGGAKITLLIAEIATSHDFGQRRSIVYT